jgi:hypothetical protein
MALTVTKRDIVELLRIVHASHVFSNSYLAGGEAADPKMSTILSCFIQESGGMQFEYDLANKKLKAFVQRGQDQVFAAAGVAIGSGADEEVLIANTVTYSINGVRKSKTTAEVAFTATTHDIAADGATVQEAVYLLSLNAAGTPKLTMGVIATGAGNAAIPACPVDEVAIGYVRIAVDAGATDFDATTDALSDAHLTDTYVDLAFSPSGKPSRTSQEVAAGTDLSGTTVTILFIGS